MREILTAEDAQERRGIGNALLYLNPLKLLDTIGPAADGTLKKPSRITLLREA
jgi:hypothetical protein